MSGVIVPEQSQTGFFSGTWFVAKHNGHQVALWVSPTSIRHDIYVDRELLANERVLSLKKQHRLTVAGTPWRIDMRTGSKRTGAIICEFFVENQKIARFLLTFRLGLLRGVLLGAAMLGLFIANDVFDWSLPKLAMVPAIFAIAVPILLLPLPGGGLSVVSDSVE